MKILRLCLIVLSGLLAAGLLRPGVVQANPPLPTGTPPPTGAVQPASAALDANKANVARLAPLDATTSDEAPAAVLEGPPNLPVIAGYDGQQIRPVTDGDQPRLSAASVSAASLTRILTQTFETGSVAPFESFDANGPIIGGLSGWAAARCFSTTGFPVENIGSYSAWPASFPSGALDPCSGDSYPANLNAWLVYGPFSLAEAQDASVDFFYRYDSPDPDDYLFWGASVDGVNFEGHRVTSGTFTGGPFPSGHNFESFDLTNVPLLGDLTGQPQVWLAFLFVSDGDTNVGQGAFIDAVRIRKNSGQKREITLQPFETVFPTGYESWLSHDNNGISGGNQRWGSADCFARSGNRSMWFARNGATGFDPCGSTPFSTLQQNDMESWLLHGPFNLEGASEAYVDFYFRSDSERAAPGATNPATDDIFYWWASIDGTNYVGPGLSGTYLTGPDRNGYNRMRFDLSNVSTLGDLRGQPNVWIAFVFDSDFDENLGSATAEGAFLDDVNVVMLDTKFSAPEQVFFPVVVKSPPPVVGGVTFENFTGNPVIIELVGRARRTFSSGRGPHVWNGIPPGVYDWIASGTCPAGAGQVGSQISGRPQVTIEAGRLDNPINQRDNGSANVFDCSG